MIYIHIIIFILGLITLVYHKCFDTSIYISSNGGKPKQKKYSDYIGTVHSGLLRGLLLGFLLGDNGVTSGIRNGAVFCVVNPLMMYINY